MMRRPPAALTLLCLTVTLCLAGSSGATMVVFERLDGVLARTRSAIVAEISSAPERGDSGIWATLAFRARSVETLFGKSAGRRELDCRYTQGKAHHRGELAVSPLISGSGMEFDAKQGDRVILLIGVADAPGEACKVLRMEPLEQKERIRRHGLTRAAR
jgi:hypothetical protein